ncbi:hypothetical protein IID62_00685 [candidate division KSB1 bacterium]|nr:hypothetical protein [candidate division KSB1 bacterium]
MNRALTAYRLKGALVSFALLNLIVLWVTCFNPFAPKLGEISSNLNVFLTAQQTPEEVLSNFQFAYTLKDSLVYRDVLDDDFVFVYRDLDNDVFLSWGKEEDVTATVGLFNNFTVINLVWNSTNFISYSLDSTTAEISKGFILSLGHEIRITGEALFSFKMNIENNIWKITRWVDKSII